MHLGEHGVEDGPRYADVLAGLVGQPYDELVQVLVVPEHDVGGDALIPAVPHVDGLAYAVAAYVLQVGVPHQGVYRAVAQQVPLHVVEYLAPRDPGKPAQPQPILVYNPGRHLLEVAVGVLHLCKGFELPLEGLHDPVIDELLPTCKLELVDDVAGLPGLRVLDDNGVDEGLIDAVALHDLEAPRYEGLLYLLDLLPSKLAAGLGLPARGPLSEQASQYIWHQLVPLARQPVVFLMSRYILNLPNNKNP